MGSEVRKVLGIFVYLCMGTNRVRDAETEVTSSI